MRLVARYAHLSPSHLKTAVEDLTDFGKDRPEVPVSKEIQISSVSDGTVTITGNETAGLRDNETEVVEKIGSGGVN